MSKKLTIYDVTGTTTREELEDWVTTVLESCVFSDEKKNIKKKFKTKKAFVEEVCDKLLDGTITIDESWEDGEDAINIEGVAYDIAAGNPIGTQMNGVAEILGTVNDKLSRFH